MINYLTLIEVLEMHKILINRFGGIHGARDLGALESALYRPQTGYYKDLIEEAAALWESIAQNHSFIDGNKRVAFAATYTFLAINGLKLKVTNQDTSDFIYMLYNENRFEYENLEKWLRINLMN
jgi:death-on-curing protein